MVFVKAGIWGLTVEAGKEYSQIVDDSFCITMAALGAQLPKNGGRTSISIKIHDKEFAVCSLTPGKIEQQVLDLTLLEGEEVTIKGTGNCPVDLTGNYLVDPYDESDDEDDLSMEIDGEDMDSEDAEGWEDMDDDEEDDDEEDDDEEDEMDIAAQLDAALKSKRKLPEIPSSKTTKKAKIVEIEEPAEAPVAKTNGTPAKKDAKTDAKKDTPAKKEAPAKNASAKKDATTKKETQTPKPEPTKKAETPVSAKAVAKQQQKEQTATPKEQKAEKSAEKPAETPKSTKKTLGNGLVVEDVTVGTGTKAKAGKKVGVRYIGRLANGKVFDSNTKGSPFIFRLGAGEVIRGWDLGVNGMNIGGVRKLTIPASLAYGSRGAPPDIPPNATLEFEVKLLEVRNK
ncbi:uncharacterized protein SPPG_07382 [Spizellomyces punctatus DAOM BR117]|uniref:FK506-binding protein n=1 Tax=Spizellomyces punctatus (strain DAOM BR117) TaxID=645134 RepID=A0A0L0H7E5_SPIPD|nr:uncharacterized protein SPPG_07382 [Spizellomyces punctatus DAOM BR117]KNC97465.1 hypothetical protein SPPG_07382 [Spizellomyces punctatus DAOM BR117]|eukprot:XP_016605505.1 hypothetical protein SPPG_07382 [Spizellomyces punctatus DAOM BR117]